MIVGDETNAPACNHKGFEGFGQGTSAASAHEASVNVSLPADTQQCSSLLFQLNAALLPNSLMYILLFDKLHIHGWGMHERR